MVLDYANSCWVVSAKEHKEVKRASEVMMTEVIYMSQVWGVHQDAWITANSQEYLVLVIQEVHTLTD